MALPKLVTPEFEATIPSTGQQILYRPFLVKEEKILMIALESGESRDIIRATKNILESCILTPGVDVNKLSTFDYEYLFLMLRAKSVGEQIVFKAKHSSGECEEFSEVMVDLNTISIDVPEISNVIKLTDTIGVIMHWPTINDLNSNAAGLEGSEGSFALIEQCIDSIYDEEEVYEQFTREELKGFIDSLSQLQFQKITDFLQSMPTLKHTVKWDCKACGKSDEMVVEGLNNFFG